MDAAEQFPRWLTVLGALLAISVLLFVPGEMLQPPFRWAGRVVGIVALPTLLVVARNDRSTSPQLSAFFATVVAATATWISVLMLVLFGPQLWELPTFRRIQPVEAFLGAAMWMAGLAASFVVAARAWRVLIPPSMVVPLGIIVLFAVLFGAFGFAWSIE
jgi:ABC-type dipeptide/oligopeptide/nickel transport system permease component